MNETRDYSIHKPGAETMINTSEITNVTNGNISLVIYDFGPQRDPLYVVLPITVLYLVIFIIGVLGNILTCFVIIKNKIMHTATNYYLFSLAISDLILLISGMPQEMYLIWSKWPYVFGKHFCVLRAITAEAATNASILTITLFTVERYLAICHPFVSHKMSKLSRASRHVFILWVVAVVLALPQALQIGIVNYGDVAFCLQITEIIKYPFEISTFVFFILPMLLITVLYSLIGLRLRDNNKKPMEFNSEIRRNHQSTTRIVKMLVVVVVAFFICWAPFHAQRLIVVYGFTKDHGARSPIFGLLNTVMTYISGVLYYMSTCINPIVYQIMSNKFRSAFKNSIRLWCCNSSERANAKYCSYTAMAIQRNPISSGNSLKNCESRRASTKKLEAPGV